MQPRVTACFRPNEDGHFLLVYKTPRGIQADWILWGQLNLTPADIHPSMHTSIHPSIHPYMHTYVLNVRKTHCERNSFKNRQNILTLFWKLFEIVGKLFENCFLQKQFYENCLNIVFIKKIFLNNFMKIVLTFFLFKICSDQFYENCLNIVFIKKSLKTILWKLFKHSFYQKDLGNNFMNIV